MQLIIINPKQFQIVKTQRYFITYFLHVFNLAMIGGNEIIFVNKWDRI